MACFEAVIGLAARDSLKDILGSSQANQLCEDPSESRRHFRYNTCDHFLVGSDEFEGATAVSLVRGGWTYADKRESYA